MRGDLVSSHWLAMTPEEVGSELASLDADGTATVRCCGVGNDAASDKNGNCHFAELGQLARKNNPSQRAEKTADGNDFLGTKAIGRPTGDQPADKRRADQHHRTQDHDTAS